MNKVVFVFFFSLFSIQIQAQDAVSILTYKGEVQTQEKNNWRSYEKRFYGGKAFDNIQNLGIDAIEFYIFTDTSKVNEVLFPRDSAFVEKISEQQNAIRIALSSNYEIADVDLLPVKSKSDEVEIEEEVIGDFKPKTPVRKKKKIRQWQVVQQLKNKPGKYLVIIAWVKDLTQTNKQKTYLLEVMKNLEYKSFDAMTYYSQNEKPSDKTIVGFSESIIKAILTKDTSIYYSRLGNLNDFDYIAGKVVELMPEEKASIEPKRKGFVREFNSNYNDFPSLLGELGDRLSGFSALNDFTFEIEESRKKKFGFVQQRLKIHLKLKGGDEVYLKMNAIESDRGIVLTDKIKLRFKSKYSVTLHTSFSKEGSRYRIANKNYFNQPIEILVNDFQGYFTHWKHENGKFVLYSNEDKIILESDSRFEGASFSAIAKLNLKKVTIESEGKTVKIEGNQKTTPLDPSEFSAIEFSEFYFDQLLRHNSDWVSQNYIDSNDYSLMKKDVFPDTIPNNVATSAKSLSRFKDRLSKSFNNSQHVVKEFFDQADGATNAPWVVYHKESQHKLMNESHIMMGYYNKGVELRLANLFKTANGYKLTKRMKLRKETFNTKEVPGLFTKEDGAKFVSDEKVGNQSLSEFLKSNENEILNWRYRYKNKKLEYVEFTLLHMENGNVEILKKRVFFKKIPSLFYDQKIQYRRLYQIRNTALTAIKIYTLLPE